MRVRVRVRGGMRDEGRTCEEAVRHTSVMRGFTCDEGRQ